MKIERERRGPKCSAEGVLVTDFSAGSRGEVKGGAVRRYLQKGWKRAHVCWQSKMTISRRGRWFFDSPRAKLFKKPRVGFENVLFGYPSGQEDDFANAVEDVIGGPLSVDPVPRKNAWKVKDLDKMEAFF